MIIDDIRPSVDGGRHPIKRVLGDRLLVQADLLSDGHDKLAGRLLYRRAAAPAWHEVPLCASAVQPVLGGQREDDRWWAVFSVDALGIWEYTVKAWVDSWQSWVWAVTRKIADGQDIAVDLRGGAALLAAAADRAADPARATLRQLADRLAASAAPASTETIAAALSEETAALMRLHPDDRLATSHQPPLAVVVDVPLAAFSSWYEMFPRSRAGAGVSAAADGPAPPPHGTFKEAEDRLAYIADLGFDVVYLPPIHPIGRTHRKGPDNSLTATGTDPGSPWAIGSEEGGHTTVHPLLGTLQDFRHFMSAARRLGLEVALDIALQASPDHPYLRAHPEWFFRRADGTIQFAENPPKKYQDIVPFDFTGAGWESLWDELRDVFLFWIEQGVTVFRVDNPHTKPLPFWRWCIASVKAREPRAIFLAEAFTRPKLMRALAKLGFSQSYTYFTWRTTKAELTEFVRSLDGRETKEFFRPNLWPNTPDILPEHLQNGTRGTFIVRAVLAATLSPNWGVYGPAFELQETRAREGTEEYARNEKYQVRAWNLDQPNTLAPVLRRLNRIRRDRPALRQLGGTVVHMTDNDAVFCYSRSTADKSDVVLVVVNLDPHRAQSGWLTLDQAALGLAASSSFQVHDLLGDARYLWSGARAFVDLDPKTMPAHIFHLRRHVRSEQAFEYYL
ncbi:MAG TPA: alpha-1,4-glucan--maltose-1-phosphate maltosyltransferase [Polyangia bacterium]|nr:alpha-1,4-glucan--maltose-1-phosphate maltosyltransferase [Polyangia bacterium]